MIHTQERFRTIVAALNTAFDGWMTFELGGSLVHQPAGQHDADIIVRPRLPIPLKAFTAGCRDAGIEVVAVDTNSATPFPGRPEGQDRVQVKFLTGEVIDLFFPKGWLRTS